MMSALPPADSQSRQPDASAEVTAPSVTDGEVVATRGEHGLGRGGVREHSVERSSAAFLFKFASEF